jgi:hypothetical protein
MFRETGRVGRGRRWLGPLAALIAFAWAGVAAGAEPGSGEPAGTPVCKDAGVKVTFERGSADLDTNGRGALAGVATWLQNGAQRTVRLEGYADKSGGAVGNQRLSERRAQTAKEYLVGRGIEPERIMIFGHGEQEAPKLTGLAGRIVLVTVCDVPKVEAAGPAPPEPETPAAEPAPKAAPPPPPSAATPAPAQPHKAAILPMQPPLPPSPPVAPTLPPPPPPKVGPPDVPLTVLGVEATVGGGAIGFIDQNSRNVTGTGASWDARVLFGSRLPIAVETAYVGSLQSIDALGLSTDAMLVGNGIEGTLRINLIRSRIQPYLFGGAGWTHYQVTNTTTNTSSVRANDDIGTVPMGAGITARVFSNLIIDVRGTYRATFSDDMLRATATNNNSMQSWNVGGRVGFEF